MGVWRKQGVILPPNTTDLNGGVFFSGTSNGTVLYDTNPQLISANSDGKVFKIWFQGASDLFYAESNTALPGDWTRRSTAVLTNTGLAKIYKFNNVYYLYATFTPITQTATVAAWTSSDGITWVSKGTALAHGGSGSWDEKSVQYMQPFYKDGSGTYYATYSGVSAVGVNLDGIATSADLLSWTNAASGSFAGGAPGPIAISPTSFYAYVAAFDQTPGNTGFGGGRTSSTDLVNWTSVIVNLPRSLPEEGTGLNTGALGPQQLIEANGKTYNFYTGTPSENNGTGYQQMLAIADMPLSSLVQTTEGIDTMALTFVQAASATFGSGTSVAKAYGSNTTSASYLIAVGLFNATSGSGSMADTLGNTWVPIGTHTVVGGFTFEVFHVPSNKAGGGANTVTYTCPTSGTNSIQVFEYTGQHATPFDVLSAWINPTIQTVTSPSITTGFTNETILVLAVQGNTSASTAGSGFTRRLDGTTGGQAFMEDEFVSAVGSYSGQFTQTASVGAFVATLGIKSASSAVPITSSGTPGFGLNQLSSPLFQLNHL